MEERGQRKCGDVSCVVMLMTVMMVGVSLLVFLTVFQTFGDDSVRLHSFSDKALSPHTGPNPDQDNPPMLWPQQQRAKREAGKGWKEGDKPSSSHQVPCTKGEKHQVACFKGECYALDLGELRSPFCQCPEMYEGPRCERLTADFYLAELKKTATIAGIIFGIIIIIVSVSLWCTCRKRRRTPLKRANERVDGLDSTKDTADGPNAENKDNVV